MGCCEMQKVDFNGAGGICKFYFIKLKRSFNFSKILSINRENLFSFTFEEKKKQIKTFLFNLYLNYHHE